MFLPRSNSSSIFLQSLNFISDLNVKSDQIRSDQINADRILHKVHTDKISGGNNDDTYMIQLYRYMMHSTNPRCGQPNNNMLVRFDLNILADKTCPVVLYGVLGGLDVFDFVRCWNQGYIAM